MPRKKHTKKAKKEKNPILKHLSGLGFTNRLALYIIMFLAVGLAGGFYLAIRSISGDYSGDGIVYAAARAQNFVREEINVDSPPI